MAARNGYVSDRQTTTKTDERLWWVNYTLTKEELKRVEAWEVSETSLLDSAAGLADEGYRLTFAKDEKNGCMLVCFFSPTNHKYHPSCALSSRSPDLWEAFKINLFKHHVVFEQRWPSRSGSAVSQRG